MPTIGRATIDVHYDGRGLPREARELGEGTGGAMADAHNEEFSKGIEKGFKESRNNLVRDAEAAGREAGKESGKGFGTQFDDALQNVVRRDLDKLSNDVANIFGKTDGLDSYRKKLTGLDSEYDSVQKTVDDVIHAMSQLEDANLLNGDSLERNLEILGKWEEEEKRGARAADDFAAALDDLHGRALALNETFDSEELDRLIESEAEATGTTRDWRREIDELNASHAESNRQYDLAERGAHDYNDQLNSLHESMRRLNPQIDEHNRLLGRISAAIESGGSIDAYRNLGSEADKLVRKTARLGDGFDDTGKKIDKFTPKFGGLLRSFGNFDPSDNIIQLLALIVAFLPQIAVLASSAAAGLVILGGAIVGLGLGVGGLVLGFSDIFGKLDKLPASVQPAARAIQGFKDDFGKLRDTLQEHLFDALAKDLKVLEVTAIPGVNRALGILGDALNKVLSQWIKDLSSSDFSDTLIAIFAGMKPVIEDLGQIVSNLFGIIGEVLKATTGDVQEFTGGISDATGDLLAFLKTPEGHNELRGWIDDAKGVLATLGEVIGEVAGAIGDLVADPKNLRDTVASLKNLGEAAIALAGVGEELGSIATAVVTLIKVIAQMIEFVSGMGNAIATAFEVVSTQVAGAINLITTLLFNLIGGPIAGAIEAFKGLGNIIGDVFTGNFAAIPGHFKEAQEAVKHYTDDMGSSIGAFVGSAGAYFDLLDSKSQATALKIAGNFGYTGDEAKEFAGNIAQVATNTGTSLQDLADDKSLEALAADMNITVDAAKLMLSGVKSSTDGSGHALDGLATKGNDTAGSLKRSLGETAVSALNQLKANAATSLDDTVVRMGASGKAAATLTTAFQRTAGDSQTALLGLSRATSWKDIEKALGGTGEAARTKMANNIIKSAQESGTSINSLPPLIQKLVEKYGTIPKNKHTDVTVDTHGASSFVDTLTSKLKGIPNVQRTVTIINKQVNDPSANAFGGIMAGGQQLAGGKRIAMASGGILNQPTYFGNVLAGEAGPEAIVPLTGALSSVDRSVRGLAAYARGQVGSVTDGKQNAAVTGPSIAAGAIVVNEAGNGQTTANAVLNRIAAKLG